MKNICIITDFDHTITSHKSISSWDVVEKSKKIPNKLKEKCKKNKTYYLKKEKTYDIPLSKKAKYMKDWAKKNLNIFIKSKITKTEIENQSSKTCMTLRKKSKTLFKYAYKNKIPIIIISAGIEDVIKNFLKSSNMLYSNVYIISNKIKYQNKIVKGFKNPIIHTLNKSEINYKKNIKDIIDKSKKIIVLGDNIEDAKLAPKNKQTLKIGFLNNKQNKKLYQKTFDIVITKDTFKKVLKIIQTS